MYGPLASGTVMEGKPRRRSKVEARLGELVSVAPRDEAADHYALPRRILLEDDAQRPRQHHLDELARLPQLPAPRKLLSMPTPASGPPNQQPSGWAIGRCMQEHICIPLWAGTYRAFQVSCRNKLEPLKPRFTGGGAMMCWRAGCGAFQEYLGQLRARRFQCTLAVQTDQAHLGKTKVRSSGLRTGPTFMRTRSPSAPASTGHGV